ncbi:MAG: C45 family autoproteolytic acyltransferase/hydrolase [Brumimicrobium sp.]
MRRYSRIYSCILLSLFILSCGMRKSVRHVPQLEGYNDTRPEVTHHNDSLISSDNNYLTKNKYGQWELYVEGDPLERGLVIGALADSLLLKQENIFFDKIKDLVPSERKQKRLRKFLQWYNRKLYKHVPEEYKTEIYGLSRYVPKENNHIAPPYIRSLYLHAAHDIGHALEDLAMVGCTSTALWGDETADGELLIGRNFDFYAGDEFAEEKVIAFFKPDKGHPFMSVTWPGMLGIVSGMNYEGLTVTMNAGKSDIPLTAKKPITILAREIIQYASTIEEAIEIAKQSEVFVSESLMIGSAKDKKAVLIEISPDKMDVYEVANSKLVCSNHFQSEAYKDDKRNNEHIVESHSMYRYNRISELLNDTSKMTPNALAEILRDREGTNEKAIGYGNEKALNQLLAHHAVIFKPEQLKVWVSSSPYQLGAFTSYDLNEIFGENKHTLKPQYIDSLTIPEDPFLKTKAYKNYEEFRIIDRSVDRALSNEDQSFSLEKIDHYKSLNPDYWVVYYKAGKLYYNAGKYELAKKEFEKALQKEITTLTDCSKVEEALQKTNKKIK